MTVDVKVKSVKQVLKDHGLEKNGAVQLYWTNLVNRRITRYMPFRSGALATKLKYVLGTDTIVVNAPYARYQYFGKVMVNSATGKGPALIPGVGYRFKKGAILKATDRDLKHDTAKNPDAGPFWDRRLIANEGEAMTNEVRNYILRRERKS